MDAPHTLAHRAQPESASYLLSDPAWRFLLAVATRQGTEAPPAHAGVAEWYRRFRLAERHSLLPAMAHFLRPHMDTIPRNVGRGLRDRGEAHARRAFQLAAQLAALLAAFAGQRIQAIPYKGPWLAQKLYSDVSRREFFDLDFLIRPGDLPCVMALLEQHGYRLQQPIPERHRPQYLRSECEFELVSDAGLHTEIHWRIVPRYFALEIEELLWQNSVAGTFAGIPATLLSPEATIVVLCVHGTKHRWSRLKWVLDIADWIRLHPSLDWEMLQASARRLGIMRLLTVPLRLAGDILRAPVPAKYFSPTPQSRALAASIVHGWAEGAGVTEAARGSYYFQARERLRDRAQVALRVAFLPTAEDLNHWSLPPSLGWLYPVARPVRLLANLVTRRPRRTLEEHA